MRLHVSVIGGAEASAGELTLAGEVGRLLGEAGCVVIAGGTWGVMKAALEAAHAAGGITAAIFPGEKKPSAGCVDVGVCTGMADARNAIVAASGDAVIAVGGALGTLSEIALALKAGKRVVLLSSWRVPEDRLPAGADIHYAQSPEEAVKKAMAADG
ncbi:MAG: hypothetical protein JW909_08160 [Planctomycetes bacterium]|nr:hypothetical protein [Planctomycetota bacterium]